jgi:hypothetical protein
MLLLVPVGNQAGFIVAHCAGAKKPAWFFIEKATKVKLYY